MLNRRSRERRLNDAGSGRVIGNPEPAVQHTECMIAIQCHSPDIPGTIGGAIVGNAGCFGHEIGEFLTEATLLRPDGSLEIVGPEAFSFGYRRSALKDSGSPGSTVVSPLTRAS